MQNLKSVPNEEVEMIVDWGDGTPETIIIEKSGLDSRRPLMIYSTKSDIMDNLKTMGVLAGTLLMFAGFFVAFYYAVFVWEML